MYPRDGFDLIEAQQALAAGSRFGRVYSQLSDPERDGDVLRAFFCFALPAAYEQARQRKRADASRLNNVW